MRVRGSVKPAGYSGTPLAKKLGFKEGTRAALVGAAPNFRATLAPLPDGVRFFREGDEPLDLVLLFGSRAAMLVVEFSAVPVARSPGMLVSLTRSVRRHDGSRGRVRAIGLTEGLVDLKVIRHRPVRSAQVRPRLKTDYPRGTRGGKSRELSAPPLPVRGGAPRAPIPSASRLAWTRLAIRVARELSPGCARRACQVASAPCGPPRMLNEDSGA